MGSLDDFGGSDTVVLQRSERELRPTYIEHVVLVALI